MNKKVLVTGASGHLGGMLFKSLADLGYKNLVGTDLKKKKIEKNKKFILADLKNLKAIINMTKFTPLSILELYLLKTHSPIFYPIIL